MTGSIWAQNIGYRIVNGTFIDTVDLSFNNRDITGDAAIALFTHGKDNIWAECGFSRVVSNGQVEEFDPPLRGSSGRTLRALDSEQLRINVPLGLAGL